ncbi:hypothetical protein H9P43_009414 [Blastocladiella emersonii ATCC 22665]|nr:hypothetical protein H9P43_009414 [Blastocladiella emersonii ATCC 22665]
MNPAVLLPAAAVVAHSHGHGHAHAHAHAHELPDLLVALLGDRDPAHLLLVCVALLALFPLVLVLVLPKSLPQPLERVLVSVALGTMLGDIFLHLMPSILAGGEHAHDHAHGHAHARGDDHHHGEIPPAVKLVGGFLAFYAVERVMGLLVEASKSHGHHHHHHHHHAHDGKHGDDKKHGDAGDEPQKPAHGITSATFTDPDGTATLRQRKSKSTTAAEPTPSPTTSTKPTTKSAVPVAALTHVLASSIHAASDGLLLAMAFANGAATGLATFFAIFLHEIPHRLADWTLIHSTGAGRAFAIGAQVVVSAATRWMR